MLNAVCQVGKGFPQLRRTVKSALLLALLLTGCSTVPVTLNEAKDAPPANVLGKVQVASSQPAKLTIIRDKSALGGSVVSFYVLVNGVQVVRLSTGEKYTLPVEPGEVFLSVRSDAIGATNKPLQIETTFKPAKSYVYRVGNDSNWLLNLQRDLDLSDK